MALQSTTAIENEIRTAFLDTDMPRGVGFDIVDNGENVKLRIDFADPAKPRQIESTYGQIVPVSMALDRRIMKLKAASVRRTVEEKAAEGIVIYRHHLVGAAQ